MLSKLIKHEFKATARMLLPLYLVLAVLTIVERVAISLNLKGTLGVITGFATLFYILSIVAITVVSFVIIILRFYKNLMTDEGYLMFTLPVSPSQLINSKLLVSFVWNIVCFVMIILSLLGAFMTKDVSHMLNLGFQEVIAEIKLDLGVFNTTLLLIEFIVIVILGLISNILIIYVSIAVGQLFNGHKILGSFASYIGISTVLQILYTIGVIILGVVFKKSFDELYALPQIVFPVSIGFTVITTILFYFGTNIIFKKKLNLE